MAQNVAKMSEFEHLSMYHSQMALWADFLGQYLGHFSGQKILDSPATETECNPPKLSD